MAQFMFRFGDLDERGIIMPLPFLNNYYTQKWVQIRMSPLTASIVTHRCSPLWPGDRSLGSMYYSVMLGIVIWLFVSLALNSDYVERSILTWIEKELELLACVERASMGECRGPYYLTPALN